jgi:hypothetical protein
LCTKAGRAGRAGVAARKTARIDLINDQLQHNADIVRIQIYNLGDWTVATNFSRH